MCKSAVILLIRFLLFCAIPLSCLWNWDCKWFVLDSTWTLLSITKVSSIKSHVPLLKSRLVAVIILFSHIIIHVDRTVFLVLGWWLNVSTSGPLLGLRRFKGELSLGSTVVVLLCSYHLSFHKVVNSLVSGRYGFGTSLHLILNLYRRWAYPLPWNVASALVHGIEACRHIGCWVGSSEMLLCWCLGRLREYLWFVQEVIIHFVKFRCHRSLCLTC